MNKNEQRIASRNEDKRFNLLGAVSLALSILVLAGCQTPASRPHAMANAGTADASVLFFPVLTSREGMSKTASELTAALHRELAARIGGNLVFAADLPHLNAALTSENLRRDGRLAAEEIRTLANTVHCTYAVVFELIDANAYAPQSLSGRLYVFSAADDAPPKDRNVVLDLANENTMDAYRFFLERIHALRIGNLESMQADRIHTALLSPRTFRQFASYVMAEDLLVGTLSAESLIKSKDMGRDGVQGSATEATPDRVLFNRGRDALRGLRRQ